MLPHCRIQYRCAGERETHWRNKDLLEKMFPLEDWNQVGPQQSCYECRNTATSFFFTTLRKHLLIRIIFNTISQAVFKQYFLFQLCVHVPCNDKCGKVYQFRNQPDQPSDQIVDWKQWQCFSFITCTTIRTKKMIR